ncbi:MAG: FitA-like ribbon-helix-helix domain-containing protein [Candidatus Binatia bacterium]
MPAIHIREIDDAVVDALKKRASRNQRSLQGEVRHILEKAAAEGAVTDSRHGRRKLRIRTVAVGGPVYSRETIYD